MPVRNVFEAKVDYLQVLDEQGHIDPQYDPKLPKELLLRMYIGMVAGRMFDDKCMKLQRQGRMFTYAPLRGQEAAQIGSVAPLLKDDWMFPSFRESVSYIYRGLPIKNLLVYWMGGQHGMQLPEGQNNFTICIPIATQMPHAVGLSWAAKIKGDKIAVLCYLGDGATSEGDFHAAMNFAGVFKTPTVFLCQNNQWAISVPRSRQSASKTLAQKALAYGFNGVLVDGNDILGVYKVTDEALKRARAGDGPTFIEAVTYRIGPHTTADDPTRYRKDEEVEYWKQRDPIKRFQIYLRDKGIWTEEFENRLVEKAGQEIEKSVEEAEAENYDRPEDIFAHVYHEMPPYLKEQHDELFRLLKKK